MFAHLCFLLTDSSNGDDRLLSASPRRFGLRTMQSYDVSVQ